jgi:hypothetical protein
VSTPSSGAGREFLLFVYDSLMSGLSEHARLAGARAVGPATTEPRFDLVDLGPSIWTTIFRSKTGAWIDASFAPTYSCPPSLVRAGRGPPS